MYSLPEGLRAQLEILNRICDGEGTIEDLDLLEDISVTMQEALFVRWDVRLLTRFYRHCAISVKNI